MFSKDAADKVEYFGHWAQDLPEARLIRDALDVLWDAANRCFEQDMRTADVKAALTFLERNIIRTALCDTYRAALNLQDPAQRCMAVRGACNALLKAVSDR